MKKQSKYKITVTLKVTVIYLLLLFVACEPSVQQANTEEVATHKTDINPSPKTGFQIPYQLNKPDTSFKLVYDLKEISGLSMTRDEQQLLAVNDEQGVIFYISPETGKVEKKVKFGKMNDYEGIEAVKREIYVTKSNGTILEVKDVGRPLQVTESFPTFLKNENDVEGLGYDAVSNSLLLACKGKAGEGDDLKKSRTIYAFDLKTKELKPEPLLVIKRATIEAFLNSEEQKSRWMNYWKEFTIEQLAKAFAPSAIALHPKTRNRYILSSSGKLLVVLNSKGEILQIEKLDDTLMRQPEGLCFRSDGTMFISSEGRGAKARLLVFKPEN